MSEHPSKADDTQVLQILIAEHNNLQAIRSGTIFEATGRTNLFLGALSSSIVALAFIGQMSKLGNAFFLFALVLLPPLIFLGLVTFTRVYQTGTEDMVASRGINRIRHYYTEIAPQLKPYFILSTHDDMKGMLQNMGYLPPGWWQLFVSTHGMVAVMNSILIAAFVGLLSGTFLQASTYMAVILSVGVFVVSVMLHFNYQNRTYLAVEEHLKVLFPTGREEKD